MTNLLLIFFALTILNVILSTVKSIVTIKASPSIAALVNALYYALYNIVLIYTVADFPMWQKVTVTFICNLFGVWIVKYFEQKARKDKLWLLKMTIPAKYFDSAKRLLEEKDISFTYYSFPSFIVFDCFCTTSNDTKNATEICRLFEGKMFATENKLNF